MADDDFFDSFFDAPLFDDSLQTTGEFWLDQATGVDDSDESDQLPNARAIRKRLKHSFKTYRQQDAARSIVGELPSPGEEIHIVGANKYDFWTWTPIFVEKLGTIDEYYCSTWTACFDSVRDFLRLVDDGKIKRGNFILGLYFKRREPVVYTTLAEGLKKRNCGWIKAIETHAKVQLLSNERSGDFITIEGSANLTANPRLEQNVIINDREVWEFHKCWMNEVRKLKTRVPWLP